MGLVVSVCFGRFPPFSQTVFHQTLHIMYIYTLYAGVDRFLFLRFSCPCGLCGVLHLSRAVPMSETIAGNFLNLKARGVKANMSD